MIVALYESADLFRQSEPYAMFDPKTVEDWFYKEGDLKKLAKDNPLFPVATGLHQIETTKTMAHLSWKLSEIAAEASDRILTVVIFTTIPTNQDNRGFPKIIECGNLQVDIIFRMGQNGYGRHREDLFKMLRLDTNEKEPEEVENPASYWKGFFINSLCHARQSVLLESVKKMQKLNEEMTNITEVVNLWINSIIF